MKRITLTILILIQTALLAQKEIVGRVEFYPSLKSEWSILRSFSDGTLRNLSQREHRIKVLQNDTIIELITDTTGIFKFRTALADSILIKVNEQSPLLQGSFHLAHNEIRDTLKLRISDKKLAVHRDSIQAPEFYRKYKEEQALRDFENGIRRVFGGGGMLSAQTLKRNRQLAKKYNLRYEYLFGCTVDRTQIRIVYWYNQVMRKLMGIEEKVW